MTAAAVLTGAGGKRIRVGAATADRVRKVADKLGYAPNLVARQLSGQPSKLIGVVAADWFHALSLRMLSWLNKTADEHGYRIISSQTNHQQRQLEQYLRECGGRGVDGVIYLAMDDDAVWPEASKLFRAIPCVVSLMGDPGIKHGHRVRTDFGHGVALAVEHLYSQGRHRIVQVLEDVELDANRQRQAGLRAAFEKLGLPFTDESICVASKDWEIDDPRFDELIEELVVCRQADAILGDNDNGAIALMNALRRRGIQPGEDVAFVGWGSDTIARLSYPTLTTVKFHLDQIAEHAIRTIIESGSTTLTEPRVMDVPVDLIVRESSTMPPRESMPSSQPKGDLR